jgi:hypothetical protein
VSSAVSCVPFIVFALLVCSEEGFFQHHHTPCGRHGDNRYVEAPGEAQRVDEAASSGCVQYAVFLTLFVVVIAKTKCAGI